MKKLGLVLGGLALVLLAVAAPAPARAEGSVGFYFGTGLGFDMPSYSEEVWDDLPSPTGQFAWEIIHLGYNFAPDIGAGVKWGMAPYYFEETSDTIEVTAVEQYLDLYFRAGMNFGIVTPYAEIGLGMYWLGMNGEENDVTIIYDPVVGFSIGVGANIYLMSGFYLAPMFSYHFAHFTSGEIDMGLTSGSYDDFDTQANVGMLMLRIGYDFGRSEDLLSLAKALK
jgi:opacity protein-like surface antigen